ncbi:hypothetical protein [Evansella clarkii]|uniref:hypothetical protein n=1 Tax=Evansella clarkii TaxID=79879 RepID=UPI000998416C|nr:hypothetical protein [Evansella clarkii]
MAGRKGMTVGEFNVLMKRCDTEYGVNYIRPTIHARSRLITAIDLFMCNGETASFSITNNPDNKFELTKAVNSYLDDQVRKNEPI